MGELKAQHEAMKQEQEKTHSEQLQGMKQQYEMSLEGNLSFHLFLQLNSPERLTLGYALHF